MSAVSDATRKAVLAFCRENTVVYKEELEAYVGAVVRARTGLDLMPDMAWTDALSLLSTGQIVGMEDDERIGISKVGGRAPAEDVDPRQMGFW